MPSNDDPALDALFLPLGSGAVRLPECALFLRARAGAWLHTWPRARFHCVQTFLPFADALTRAGEPVAAPPAEDRHFPLVLVLPPRQRDEARALLAHALRHALPGGTVVVSQSNNEGARSGEADLQRIAGAVHSLSKHKCRVFWTKPLGAGVDTGLIDEWSTLDALRPIDDGRYVSRPGLFAWDRIDAASALLARHLPDTLHGRVADLGAGYGYLACEVVRRCAEVDAIDLYEAEQRALEAARINVARAVRESTRAVAADFLWHDVMRGLPRRYDAIVSNPPFHHGRADRPELGQAFIAAAANALLPGGELWLVANRHLPYETVMAARFDEVRNVATQGGFKVIAARGVRR